MNIYKVSFFGHREIDNIHEVEKRLELVVSEIVRNNEYVDFLVGREGDFDIMVSSVIRRIKARYDSGNSTLTLVIPYMKADYKNNERYYLNYYDEIELCVQSSSAHYKSAIQIRNRYMVDHSDLIICCIQKNCGGAYATVQYALKQGHKVFNLSDDSWLSKVK